MNLVHAVSTPRWSTSSFASANAPAGHELSALQEHLSHCRGARGRWFSLRCAAEAMNTLVAGRFVTTLAVAALVIGSTALFL